jgi:hypothetical protein
MDRESVRRTTETLIESGAPMDTPRALRNVPPRHDKGRTSALCRSDSSHATTAQAMSSLASLPMARCVVVCGPVYRSVRVAAWWFGSPAIATRRTLENQGARRRTLDIRDQLPALRTDEPGAGRHRPYVDAIRARRHVARDGWPGAVIMRPRLMGMFLADPPGSHFPQESRGLLMA